MIDALSRFWDPSRYSYPWMEGDALDPVRRPFGPAGRAYALERVR